MTKISLFAAAALLTAVPAFAQTAPSTQGQRSGATSGATQMGSPGMANSGQGSVGFAAPGGDPAARASNNSAADGNADQQTRPVPNTGKGGGGGSGGGAGN